MRTLPCGPSVASFPSRSQLFGALDVEWQRLVRCPRAARLAATWQLGTNTRIATLDDVLIATGYGRLGSADSSADTVLRRLVELAVDDELAARVVLQRIIPGLRRMPTRQRVPGASLAELDGEVVGAAWTVIRTFPVATRGRFVAAQLLRDVEYRVFRLPKRRLATFVPTAAAAFERPAAEVDRPAADELGQVLDEAGRAGLHPDDMALLRRLAGGTSTVDLAREQSVTDRMIRYRRAAAIDRVRELALA